MRRCVALLVVGAALVFALACQSGEPPLPAGDGKAQASGPVGFPVLPPVPTADPSVRTEREFRLPTRLTVERTATTLAAGLDAASVEVVKVAIGKDMVTGLKDELFVYRGSKLVVSGYAGLQGGPDPSRCPELHLVLNRAIDKVPNAGEGYTVEVRLTLFETDIPTQHLWAPETGKYKVLWARTLKADVGP